ncbi:MAG: site-specific DNA-methyltransferase [Chloroflexi bacterium]|nr:site-specific DNA-methyltransferase [Chloroflexota bacterium]
MASRLPDDCCDLIITDPPFAIEFSAKRSNYNRTASRVLNGYNEISAEEYLQFTRDWLTQARRVLKDSGSMYIFSGWNNLKDILIAADELGLQQINHIIWKYQFGVATKRKFVTSHYHCLYYCIDDKKRKFYPNERFNGDERTANGGSARYRDMEDVWDIKREYWTGDVKTPTKLPRELVSKILAYSSEPGDLVLDPFLGSGQVAVVSHLEGRNFVGFEIVAEYYDLTMQRIKGGGYKRIKASNWRISDKETIANLSQQSFVDIPS